MHSPSDDPIAAKAASEIHPSTGQPVGLRVDTSPARRPGAIILEGRHGRIERLQPDRHGPQLWNSLEGHDELWTYMAHGPFPHQNAFLDWLAERTGFKDPMYYAVVDNGDRALGLMALRTIRTDMRVIEVGRIVLAPLLQRTTLATEAQFLLARYVFETLGFRRYEWKSDVLNVASCRAALRLGFKFEGVFRGHLIVKGRNCDSAWFAMLDSEWPARKAAFERWLAPGNFDDDGHQKSRLARGQAVYAIWQGA
ncbi:MAG: GNAT family N-acetyltransferase [Xanthobacteraceae bacterium]|nr:GNAT family N-acetyltransferase [Xanthobacteraceae bacterium]